MSSVTLQMPEDVVDDMKRVAPMESLSRTAAETLHDAR